MGGSDCLLRNEGIATDTKKEVLEIILMFTVFYGSYLRLLNSRERRKVDVSDMKRLRKVLGVGVTQRIRNRELALSLLERVDQSFVRWFGHMKEREWILGD